jgi:O-antigen/teichoic acid export membrane protein
MNRTSRALHSTLVVSIFGYAAQGLSLVAIPLFLATVGAEGYGLMVTVMAFMGYLTFADAGLSWGSMILIAQAHGRGGKTEIAHIVRHSIVLAAGSGLVVALAVVSILAAAAFGWRLPMFAHHPEADRLILIAGVQLGLSLQFGVYYNLFQGLQEGYWSGFYQGLSRLLGLVGAMAAAWMTHSVAAMMLAQLAFTTLSGIAAGLHAWRRHPWVFATGSWTDRAQYLVQLRIGAKSFMLQIGRTLGGTAPTLGISSILGPASVPFYTVPATLLSMFFTPINSWNANMQSAYGEAWIAGDKNWVRGAFKRTLERALLLGGLGVALFLALGDSFIRLWTHHRLWLSPAMAASATGIVVMVSLLTAGQYLLTGLNRHRNAAMAEIANGLLSMALVVLAVRWFGLGAVGAGVLCAASMTSAWVLRREITLQLGSSCFPTYSFILKLGLAVAVGAIAAMLMVRAGASSSNTFAAVFHLALAGATGIAGYLVVAFTLKLVTTGEMAALGQRFKLRLIPSPL